MKTIKSKWFPFGNFKAINLFGILFYKGDYPDKTTLNHESIHTAQMKEMWYIGFYLWYFVEWLYQGIIRLFNKNMKAYRFITFEQEAYDKQQDLNYLTTRQPYSWWEYIGKWQQY